MCGCGQKDPSATGWPHADSAATDSLPATGLDAWSGHTDTSLSSTKASGGTDVNTTCKHTKATGTGASTVVLTLGRWHDLPRHSRRCEATDRVAHTPGALHPRRQRNHLGRPPHHPSAAVGHTAHRSQNHRNR